MPPTEIDLAAISPRLRTTALVILAAGESRRFGPQDKLAAQLAGRPVVQHLRAKLEPFHFGQCILVCRDVSDWADDYERAGYAIVRNTQPEAGMVNSLRLGVGAVQDVSHVLICLADMPLIRADHIAALLALSQRYPTKVVASRAEGYVGPPALLPVDALADLPTAGDAGARHLLGTALTVEADRASLDDLDTQEDLDRLRNALCS